MEYYGKILCISADDLTRDDRTWVDGVVVDEAKTYIISKANYCALCARGKLNVVRRGARNSPALVEYATIPERFKERIRAKYGTIEADVLRNWYLKMYEVDTEARAYYSKLELPNGSRLSYEKITEYTANASALKALGRLLDDRTARRKAMKAQKVNWAELSGAISFYREEHGHTLPKNAQRVEQKYKKFRAEGYISLVSGKYGNQSARKVNYDIERLLLSLDCQPERPYNKTVAEMYNQFLTGEIEVYDPETGELYDPAMFTDKKGNAIVLNEKTIANYLNSPKNKALRAKYHTTAWDFNKDYRPYHLRKSPEWALSKVSLDDRDLPRKLPNGQRVKAYYAYDVVSGVVVGYAYSRKKTEELFLDCLRNMFQMLERNGWAVPAEVEVEHHLVSNFADGLMRAGEVFPLVRWCNPGNSREKRAEHLNRAKKYGVEKQSQVGIGRWYAKLEANRPKIDKVYDELNNTYKEATYEYEELVADDIRSIQEFNSQLHPNQKKYPKMTRWDVLCRLQNPDLRPVDKAVLYRYIGEHTRTTIRQNAYLQVQYRQYRLPNPEMIERLQPRNFTVDAYYLANEEGEITEVYIYQEGRYICCCAEVARYNEATAEQTEKDRAAYTEQAKYVAQFDAMMKREKITKVGIIKKTEEQPLKEVRIIDTPAIEEQDDEWYYDPEEYRSRAISSL